MNQVKKRTIIRTIVLAVAFLNQILVVTGYSPLPFESEEIELFISTLFTILASVNTWWKDNDITRKTRDRKAKLDDMDKNGKEK